MVASGRPETIIASRLFRLNVFSRAVTLEFPGQAFPRYSLALVQKKSAKTMTNAGGTGICPCPFLYV